MGIFRSFNAGASWISAQAGPFTDMEFKPGNPNIVYAVAGIQAGGTFYKSIDGGASFFSTAIGLPPVANVARLEIGVTPDDSNCVYVVAVKKVTWDLYGFYRSLDGGDNFSLRSAAPNILAGVPGSQAWYNLSMAVSPIHRDTIIVGGTDCWKSTDGGLTWMKHTSNNGFVVPFVHPDHHDLEFLPGTDSVYFSSNDGGIWKTTDWGITWNPINEGLQIAMMYKLGTSVLHPYTIITGHQDMATHRLQTNNWDIVTPNTGDGMECIYEYDNDTIMYLESYMGRIIKTINTFPLFNVVCSTGGAGVNASGNWITPVVMHPVFDTILLVGKSQVYRTINAGTSFVQVGNIAAVGGNFIALAYAPSNPNFIYAAKANHLFVTTDGNIFNEISAGLPVPVVQITSIAVSNTNPEKVWVTFSGYSALNKVWASADTGHTWSPYSTGLPNLPVNCIVYQNNTNNALYVGTDVGVYYRSDSLASWLSLSNGLPHVDVQELEIAYTINKIRAATNGRGLWESDLPITTGVALPIEMLSFTGYNYSKNNYLEWRTATEIHTQKFEIERSSDAKLFIKKGEVTASGISGIINNYTFTDFDVPSGINYYRLKDIDFNNEHEYSKIIAIQNSNSEIDFEIYPVPFRDQINISLYSKTIHPVEIKITDLFGRTVFSEKVFIPNMMLRTTLWNSGIYFLKIEDVVKKIVKP